MRATAEVPGQSIRTEATVPEERTGKCTVVHASAREHQRSAFALDVVIAVVRVGSTTYLDRQLVFRMQTVESHLFDVSVACRACVAEFLVVSGVCVVCVACTLIAAVVLAVLDVDSVAELPHVAEPVLDP